MNQTNRITFPKNLGRLVFWGLTALLAITVIIEFPDLRARIWNTWPYLLILLCPLMHIFMHRSPGGYSGYGDHAIARRSAEQLDQSEETKDE